MIKYNLDTAQLIQFKTYEEADEARYDIYNWFDVWAFIITYRNDAGHMVHSLRFDD